MRGCARRPVSQRALQRPDAAAKSAVDLRTFLDSLGDDLLEIGEPVSVVHEMTALQHELDRAGRFPVLRFSRPMLAERQD